MADSPVSLSGTLGATPQEGHHHQQNSFANSNNFVPSPRSPDSKTEVSTSISFPSQPAASATSGVKQRHQVATPRHAAEEDDVNSLTGSFVSTPAGGLPPVVAPDAIVISPHQPSLANVPWPKGPEVDAAQIQKLLPDPFRNASFSPIASHPTPTTVVVPDARSERAPSVSSTTSTILPTKLERPGSSHDDTPLDSTTPLQKQMALVLTFVVDLARSVAEPVQVGGPVFLMQLARVLGIVVMYFAAARIVSTEEMAAVSLILSLNNVLLLTFGVGIATVLDTQCVRLFGSDPTTPRLGLLWRRAVLLFMCWSVPVILVILAFGRPICRLLLTFVISQGDGPAAADAPSPAVVESAFIFLCWSPLTTLSLGLFMITQKYYITQCNLWYPFVGHLVSVVCTIVFCFGFTAYLQHNILGVAVGTGLARVAGLLTLWGLGLRDPALRKTFGRWPWMSVVEPKGLRAFIRLLPASLAVSCSERWAFEWLNILAAFQGTTDLVAYSVSSTLCDISFAIGYGTYSAGNFMVGNALGRGRSSSAKSRSYKALGCCAFFTVLFGVVMWVFDEEIVHFYLGKGQHDSEVIRLTIQLVHLSPFVAFAYNLAFTYQGIMRACGALSFLSKIVPVSHWVVSSPAAAVLSVLFGLKVTGVLVGLIIGLSLQASIQCWRHRQLDFKLLSDKLVEEMKEL